MGTAGWVYGRARIRSEVTDCHRGPSETGSVSGRHCYRTAGWPGKFSSGKALFGVGTYELYVTGSLIINSEPLPS